MELTTRDKWDAASGRFDWMTFGEDKRFGPYKRKLFAKVYGRVLMVGAGTGMDFKFYPAGLDATAIDISPKMLARASARAAAYGASLKLREMDVCKLDFRDESFDTVTAVCTFCSVAKPVVGLREIYRVLKPGGQLLMFEHMRSGVGPIGIMMDLMTPLSSRFGPALNRDTVGNVQKAGFRLRRIENVYLDIVKTIEAVRS